MDRSAIRIFRSFEEADAAEELLYRNMSPQDRLDVLLEILQRHREAFGEAAERFERVCSLTQFQTR
jgi:hypothetical protein